MKIDTFSITGLQQEIIDAYAKAHAYGDNRYGRQRRCRHAALKKARAQLEARNYPEADIDYIIDQAIEVAQVEIRFAE